MSLRRKNPLFVGALTLCGALALGETFLIWERWSASRHAAAKLQQRQSDLAGMANTIPPPSREVATAIEEDLARAQRALESMRTELKGKGAAGEKLRNTKVPAARTDAYFDLATYVERMRDLAKKNQVGVRPEASRFGFSAYANEGPEAERIEPVFRQRQIAQYLVESLLEAKPMTLLAVKREPTLTKPEREAREQALAQAAEAAAAGQPLEPGTLPELPVADGPDYFVIDPRASARMAGFVDTEAFRFVFTAQTASLRTFLNKLASFELPVLVREVEVEPAGAEDLAETPADEAAAAPAEGAPAEAPASVVLAVDAAPAAEPKVAAKPAATRPARPAMTPIVTRPISRFTVTVEFVSLVTATPKPGEEQPPAPQS